VRVLRLSLSSAVLSGPAAAERLGAALYQMGMRTAFVACGPRTHATAVARSVRESLRAAGLRTVEGVRGSAVPTIADAEALSREIGGAGADVVVAIGGGSAIDVAKVALIALAEGCPVERHAVSYVPGGEPVMPRLAATKLPLVAVPTTFSGSEGNGSGLMRGGAVRYTRSFRDDGVAPSMVVLDPLAGRDQDSAMAVASALNAIAHGVDVLYSRARTPLSDALATESLRGMLGALPLLSLAPDDARARTQAQWASLLAGYAIRYAYVGVHHAIAHALVSVGGIPHRVAHAALLPATIGWHLAHLPPLEARRLAERLPDDWERTIRAAAHETGVPASLRQAGVREATLERVADDALHDRGAGNEIVPISRDDILTILAHAWDGHARRTPMEQIAHR
jgi:alcohol dehydrogenase class IV